MGKLFYSCLMLCLAAVAVAEEGCVRFALVAAPGVELHSVGELLAEISGRTPQPYTLYRWRECDWLDWHAFRLEREGAFFCFSCGYSPLLHENLLHAGCKIIVVYDREESGWEGCTETLQVHASEIFTEHMIREIGWHLGVDVENVGRVYGGVTRFSGCEGIGSASTCSGF